MLEIAFAGVLQPLALIEGVNVISREWQQVHAHQYMNGGQESTTNITLDKPENHISDKPEKHKG